MLLNITRYFVQLLPFGYLFMNIIFLCSFLTAWASNVQREGLKIFVESITAENNRIGGWMDYPENASIIDLHEQQSEYYDRYKLLTAMFASNWSLIHLILFISPSLEQRLYFLSLSFTIGTSKTINFHASLTRASLLTWTKAMSRSRTSLRLYSRLIQPIKGTTNMVE